MTQPLPAFGLGIGVLTVSGSSIPLDGVDGTLLEAVLLMGLAVGSLYLGGLLWAVMQGLHAVGRLKDNKLVATAAVVLAYMLILPLNSIMRGEVGFLFFSLLGIINSGRSKPATLTASQSIAWRK